MILVILKFSYLAALAVMLVCPVCKYHHQKEVSKCQRCNWSMQNDIEISREHEILTICVPTLVKSLEDEQRAKNGLFSHLQILDPDIQKRNNQKLDEIQEEIEKDREQTYKQFINLNETINELKSLLKELQGYCHIEQNNGDISKLAINHHNLLSSNDTSTNNIKIENDNSNLFTQSDIQPNSLINLIDSVDDNHNSFFIQESDHNQNNVYDLNLNLQEGNLYQESDRESSENFQTQQYIESQVNSNGSYHSFYRLIKNGQLEAIKVAVPQETVEKIRGGTNSELKFINDRKGNYWIVNWHEVYCLIPKEKININQYQYGNFQRIFNCQNYQETYKNLEVIEPATVLKSDDETWQLERKGKIKFI